MNTTTIKAALTADWGPAIEAAVRAIAAVAAWVYVLGLGFGTWIHGMNDSIAALFTPPDPPAAPLALLPAPTPVDGFGMALQLIDAGFSVRRAAREVGIARSTLQRRLREVAA
ncbi:MAG: helix-turn-helix domain-containing protein [Synechococcaceae cyanobacterium]|nr:helix-turn-helix domain-containing protein [Synechococcaceae cyanobacterium]